MSPASFFVWVLLSLSVTALTIDRRQSAKCSKYVIIDTRGTNEPQGPSKGFLTINSNILSKFPGGSVYDTVYPASFDQISIQGSIDIVRRIQAGLASDPKTCFVLEGYSQGAAATVNALPFIFGAAFNAVKAVFLIGDPCHRAGLSSNVDQNNGTSTRNSFGLQSFQCGIPFNWVGKTLDVCIFGDGVCDIAHGFGITAQHGLYPKDAATQNLGTTFISNKLTAG